MQPVGVDRGRRRGAHGDLPPRRAGRRVPPEARRPSGQHPPGQHARRGRDGPGAGDRAVRHAAVRAGRERPRGTEHAFHEWSAEAQPDGYPDEIVWQVAPDAGAAVQAVETGAADILAARPSRWIASRRSGHAIPTSSTSSRRCTTFFEFMNTTLAPFNDPDVRRAVNLATDRDKLVELWGGPVIARRDLPGDPARVPGLRALLPVHRRRRRDVAGAGLLGGEGRDRAGGRAGREGDRPSADGFPRPHRAVGEYFVGLLNELGMVATLEPMIARRADRDRRCRGRGVPDDRLWIFPGYPAPSAQIVGTFTCPDFAPFPGSQQQLRRVLQPRHRRTRSGGVAAPGDGPVGGQPRVGGDRPGDRRRVAGRRRVQPDRPRVRVRRGSATSRSARPRRSCCSPRSGCSSRDGVVRRRGPASARPATEGRTWSGRRSFACAERVALGFRSLPRGRPGAMEARNCGGTRTCVACSKS